MKVIVKKANVYGKPLVYPVCETAIFLAKLTGRKTFSPEVLDIIKDRGYDIEVEAVVL